jgi:hypothetical protein
VDRGAGVVGTAGVVVVTVVEVEVDPSDAGVTLVVVSVLQPATNRAMSGSRNLQCVFMIFILEPNVM